MTAAAPSPDPRATDPRATHEAFTLPLLFLTVALAGGLRIDTGGHLSFLPPPLMTLVLAVMLVGTLFRAGVLFPDALVNPGRSRLQNASGIVILCALFAASAQVFHATTPEAGLLAFVWNVGYVVLLANLLITRPDRSRLLASLLIVFGAAFVIKHVVLAALYAPAESLTKRVVMALFEGVTFGALVYQPTGAATGYVVFFALLGFLIGLALMPGFPPTAEMRMTLAEPTRALAARDPADR
jgi:hypothetical protein